MGSRGAFIKSGKKGIAPDQREYSVIDYIDGVKVIQWDLGKNNRTPVYSNTPDTKYYSYSTKYQRIERICFYKDHRLVWTIDMEKNGRPAHAHKWSHAGMMVGRAPHNKENTFELSDKDLKYYNAAKNWNNEHKRK